MLTPPIYFLLDLIIQNDYTRDTIDEVLLTELLHYHVLGKYNFTCAMEV